MEIIEFLIMDMQLEYRRFCFNFDQLCLYEVFNRAYDKLTSIIEAIGDASYKVNESQIIFEC